MDQPARPTSTVLLALPLHAHVVVQPGPDDPAERDRQVARQRALRVAGAADYLRSLGYVVIPPDEVP